MAIQEVVVAEELVKDMRNKAKVRPPTKAKDNEDALTIKDVVTKAKGAESKPKADDPKSKTADPKEDPPRAKANL
nr:hypothetical protein CFP56_61805 [Quercus suber]